MFDAFCLSYWYVWQGVSWHDLACLVQRMHLWSPPFVIWACAVAATIAFDFASGGMLPCLMPDYLYFVWQAVSWHDLACLVHRMLLMVHCKHLWFEHLMLTLLQEVYCHVWCLFIDICLPGGVLTWFGMFRLRLWHDLAWFVPGAILKGGQDTTRARKSPENKCEGFLHGSLSRVGKITLPIHPDNPHLTTFTQHVMVGITRSKVILWNKILFFRNTYLLDIKRAYPQHMWNKCICNY